MDIYGYLLIFLDIYGIFMGIFVLQKGKALVTPCYTLAFCRV